MNSGTATLSVALGDRAESFSLPEANLAGVLLPNDVSHALTGEAEVRRALREPIGAGTLDGIVRPGETVAIVTSDVTRPMPTAVALPPLLDALHEAGVRDADILVVFALGSHRRQTEEEHRKLMGPSYGRVRCMDSDPADCVHLGVTKRGTPVDVFRPVAEADRRICLGNIEYHYFAGYSGGAKAIMPGVSTREAIQSNHSRMVLPEACAGRLEGNPVREDIEEAAALAGVDYILNVVLDEHKKIVRAVAGDVTAAHRAGCRYLDTLYAKPLSAPADIVIVSQGGAPKDINLYQTQKALDNAKHAVRDGGIIILVGSCREGYGEGVFAQWLEEADTAHSLVERVRREFRLGGHKAAAIALVLERARVFLVSDMPESMAEKAFLTPYASVQKALDDAFALLGPAAKVLVMPYGGSTLPKLDQP